MARVPSAISLFAIFNTSLGLKEGEEAEKILFYYPMYHPEELRLNNIGLCEALIHLTLDITKKDPVKVVKTEKRIRCFMEPEKNYWIVIELLFSNREEAKKRDGDRSSEETDFSGEDVGALLNHIYQIYRLFHGKLSTSLSESSLKGAGDENRTLENLEKFIANYLSALDIENLNVFTRLDGLQYLPIESKLFLEIQKLMNSTSQKHKEIAYSLLIYGDNIVWSDLPKETVRLIYKYLKAGFTLHTTLSQEEEEENPFLFPSYFREGFLTNQGGDKTGKNVRQYEVFLDDDCKMWRMVLFKRDKFTCIYVVDAEVELPDTIFQRIYSDINSEFKRLSISVSQYLLKGGGDEKFKFIYFNHRNLALKSSLKIAPQNVQHGTLSTIMNMNKEFSRSGPEGVEMLAKMHNNTWIVGKKTEGRELYVIIDQKDIKIQEVEDEVEKLSRHLLQNIFFL